MFDYLQKYNNLPKEIKDKISTPNVMSIIEKLEQKYGLSLAAIVMKVVIKDIGIKDLEKIFVAEYSLNESQGKELSNELKEKIFVSVADYLEMEQKLEDIELVKEKTSNAPSARSSNFFFSSEDEEEIQKLAENAGGYIQDSSFNNNIEERLNDIIKKTQINFGSNLLSIRFKDILKTYLRGIRDRLETKHTLTKPIVSGGLGFDIKSSENVLKITDGNIGADKIKIKPFPKIFVPEDKEKPLKKLEELPRGKIEKLKDIGVRDVDYDLSSLEKRKKEINKLDTGHELAPPPPSLPVGKAGLRRTGSPPPTPLKQESEVKSKKLDIKYEEFKKPEKKKVFYKFNYGFKKKKDDELEKKDETKTTDKERKNMIDARPMAKTGGKIKMEDVKFEPKTMGPIDELRHMNLINFRRFDKDPFKAVEKIKEKISLFENEYRKKLEGIKAWRLSPLNKLYLKIGEESISKRKPIDAIIEERKTAGDDYLNAQEIDAIIRLNKSLRF